MSPLFFFHGAFDERIAGGAASKNGTLRVGDQIIAVNGCDVTVMSRIEAWKLMNKLPDGVVTLVIRQSLNADTSS